MHCAKLFFLPESETSVLLALLSVFQILRRPAALRASCVQSDAMRIAPLERLHAFHVQTVQLGIDFLCFRAPRSVDWLRVVSGFSLVLLYLMMLFFVLGTYAPLPGFTACLPCASGSFSSNGSACEQCPEGTAYNVSTTQCVSRLRVALVILLVDCPLLSSVLLFCC